MKYLKLTKILLSLILLATIFLPIASCTSCEDENGLTVYKSYNLDESWLESWSGDKVTYTKEGETTITCTMVTEYTYSYELMDGDFSLDNLNYSNLLLFICLLIMFPLTMVQYTSKNTTKKKIVWALQILISAFGLYLSVMITWFGMAIGGYLSIFSFSGILILNIFDRK